MGRMGGLGLLGLCGVYMCIGRLSVYVFILSVCACAPFNVTLSWLAVGERVSRR